MARLSDLMKKKSTFDRNLLMIVAYIVFNLSSTQAVVVEKWSKEYTSASEIQIDSKPNGILLSLVDKFVMVICKMISQGKEESLQ